MKPIHVLVSGAPGLMREIVTQAVTSQADMTLIDTIADISLGSLSAHGGADVVVFLLDSDVASADAALRRTFSTCAVVAVDSGGGGAWSYDYELRRAGEVVGELTPEAVIGAIRSSAERLARRESALRSP